MSSNSDVHQSVGQWSDTGARLVVLDGMRGIAAIGVMLSHFTFVLAHKDLVPGARLAVDFFFILSGFVLGQAYAMQLATGKLGTFEFIIIRAIRLSPMWMAGLTLGLVLALRLGFSLTTGLPLY